MQFSNHIVKLLQTISTDILNMTSFSMFVLFYIYKLSTLVYTENMSITKEGLFFMDIWLNTFKH